MIREQSALNTLVKISVRNILIDENIWDKLVKHHLDRHFAFD